MAFTPILAMDHRNGAFRVLQYTGASVQPIGDEWSTGPETSADTDSHVMMRNRVVQFKESNQLIAVAGNEIRAYRDIGTLADTWEVVHTFVSPDTNTDRKIGPYIIYVNDTPTLVVIYKTSTSTNNFIAVTSTDGENWTEGTVHSTVFGQYAAASFYGSHVHRNVIYWWGTTASGTRIPVLWSYDLGADTFNSISPTGGVHIWNANDIDNVSAISYNGKHYCIAVNSASTRWNLLEIIGGSFTVVGNLTTVGPAHVAAAGYKSALFVDDRGPTEGPAMYALIFTDRGADVNFGWVCVEMEDDGMGGINFNDITSTVMPSSLAPGATQRNNSRFGAFYDRPNDQHILYFAASGSTSDSWDVFRWNGNATLIGNSGSPDDSGGDASNALSLTDTGSGSRMWQPDELQIIVENRQPVTGGEKLFFRIYSQTGTEDVKVSLFYNENDEQCLTQGTITDNSHGSISMNENTGLVADDGATLYSFTWLASTDGFSSGDAMRRQLRVFV
jgi:hypothetical protein